MLHSRSLPRSYYFKKELTTLMRITRHTKLASCKQSRTQKDCQPFETYSLYGKGNRQAKACYISVHAVSGDELIRFCS